MVAGQRAIYALAGNIRSRLNALFLACAFFGGAVGSGFSGFAVASGGTIDDRADRHRCIACGAGAVRP